jgi:MoxR-like ATPase
MATCSALCFKGSTAIGNTLLRLTNERLHNDGTGDKKVPLIALFAASNEYPQDGELGAMFDRFIIRKNVGYIARPQGPKTISANLMRLIRDARNLPQPTTELTLAELEQAHREAMTLPVADATWKMLGEIVQDCFNAGINPSDRRLTAIPEVIKAYAYVHGAKQVEPMHLEVLAHVLWDEPQEGPRKVKEIIAGKGVSVRMRMADLMGQIADVIAKCPERNIGETARKQIEDANEKLNEIRAELNKDTNPNPDPSVTLARAAEKDARETISLRYHNIKEI